MSVTMRRDEAEAGRQAPDRMRPGHTDIVSDSWILRALPPAARPYARLARLDRPIGTWLLLFPGWWAIALAAPRGDWPDAWLMALFAIGAVVMRGAGCTINDILDRDIDAKVERTRGRPLPSGQVSLKGALVFLAAQLAVGLAVLLQLNLFSIALGAASLLLVFTYPLMKRVTWWPQAFLGLTFNWGALLGWAAVRGQIDTPALLLYAGGILWTLGYDTIYAHQDKEDDARVGVKSTALRLGAASRRWVGVFYVGAMVLWTAALVQVGEPIAMVVPLAMTGLLLWRQVRDWDMDDPADSLEKFRNNRNVGWVLLIAATAGIAAASPVSSAGGGGPADGLRDQPRLHPPFQLVSDKRPLEPVRPMRSQTVRGPVGVTLPVDRVEAGRPLLAPSI